MGFDETRRVKVGELEIAYREAGPAQGEPVVLVHGWPLSSRTWRKVVPGLAEPAGLRCLALDLLGCGASLPAQDADLGLGAQACVLEGFVDALGLERCVLIGHDSGGSVARGFAVAHPERVSRLLLADTEVPGHRPPLVVALSLLARLPGSARLLASLYGSKWLSRSPAGLGLCFADLGRFAFDEFFEAVVEPNARSPESIAASHRFLLDFDFAEVDAQRPRYHVLRMPTCLIWGERDRFFPPEQGRRLYEMLPEPKRIETVPGAGLFVHEEQPEAWVKIVRRFIESG